MTRLDQNRAVSLVADKVNRPADKSSIQRVVIWGNHSATQVPDLQSAIFQGKPLVGSLLKSSDEAWMNGEFMKLVQQRGAAIIGAMGKSSAASAATAACDHIRNWILGSPEGEYVSMGVISNGEYGAPKDVIYSFPCVCVSGEWKIVQGLKMTDAVKDKCRLTGEELLAEKKDAFASFQK